MITKCYCQHCNGQIEVEAESIESNTTVVCPHCHTVTTLSFSNQSTPPQLSKSVKGTILDYTIQTNSGVVSGDDGHRYSFQGAQWRESGKFPTKGMRVDFSPQNGEAIAIYELRGDKTSTSSESSSNRPLAYQGYYRSSDEKTIGGVCGGLAHKMNVSRGGLQAAFVILAIIYLIGLIGYIVCWIVFKPLPTKGIKFGD